MQKTHAEYLKLAKELEASDDKPSLKLAVLSSFTAEFLRPYILVESNALNCRLKSWFGPFNQFEQMIFNANSTLWKNQPDILWIAMRLEDVDRYLINEFSGLEPAAARDRLRILRERLVMLAKSARDNFQGPILVSNLTVIDQEPSDIFDAANPNGLTCLVDEQNHILAEELSQINDTYPFDYAGCIASQGRTNWRDYRLWYMARLPISQSAQQFLAKSFVRIAMAVLHPPAKCIVIDLDNTIWGGVVGDDGPEGIKLGDDYPGSIFKDFQSALLGYRKRGFLLAIASKNDEKLVRDVLDTHPEMILRTKHFASIQANWSPKPVNLRRIAEELNIGLDSFVFIDDNPVECEYVRSELPMVFVVNLPTDPLYYLSTLRKIVVLDRPRVLQEDRIRADMYQQESKRKDSYSRKVNIKDFLAGLEMTAQIGVLDGNSIERVYQLIQKTNQFNLTTRRHKLEDIKLMAESKDCEVAWLRLRDKFGELGLVCVGIVKLFEKDIWEVDTFLMSCRVMGRTVEDAFLSYLAELVIAKGARISRGVYSRTAKNKPVVKFYPEHGFTEVGHPDKDNWVYEIELNNKTLLWPDYIQRIDKQKEKNNYV
ncbi:MAG: HAD-IIIC family phosphatase [Planctomycetota bacterium]